MQSLFEILMLLLNVLWFFIIAHVIMSWLINFQVLNLRQPIVGQIWDGLNRILEPIYGPIRNALPRWLRRSLISAPSNANDWFGSSAYSSGTKIGS